MRDGLFETAQSTAPSTVPDTEKDLIALEDLIIDKMGELSSTMVRMETVRNHDEDYVMALDKQISKDLEIDMSEAIMRLTKYLPLTKQLCKWGLNFSIILCSIISNHKLDYEAQN